MLGRATLVLLSSSLALTLCSGRLAPPRTVDQDEGKIEDHPWILSLRKESEHRCGASIIGPQWALTAAKCVQGLEPTDVTLAAGSAELTSPGWVAGVDYIKVHPDYNKTENDIALLHTRLEFPFGPKIQAIYLAEHELIIGHEAEVTGWSIMEDHYPNYSPTLQDRVIVTVEMEQCNNHWFQKFPNHNLCGLSTRELCVGDEGAPLERGIHQYGILSKVSCISTPSLSVYVNVPYYISWITDVQLNYSLIDDYR